MAEKFRSAVSSDKDLQTIRGSQLSSMDFRCPQSLSSDQAEAKSENQASTRSSCGAQSPQNPLSHSEDDKSSMACIKLLEKRKRKRNKSPDSTSPLKKKRKICRDISQGKRNRGVKRPYGEISKGSKIIPEISSPERKRRRLTTDTKEKDTKLPSTSKEALSTMIQVKSQKRKEKASRSESDTRSSGYTSTEKKRKKTGTKIWIIGSSYVHRGERAAHEKFGENFGLDANVKWFGKGGMRWSGVLPRFYAELSSQSPPDILVIHAGGNDLGLMYAKELASVMKKEMMQLHAEFPSMVIVYSCINERQMWRNGWPVKINKDRKTVNRCMRMTVGDFGGEVIEHPLLRYFDNTIFLRDGVHFTKEGNEIFVTSIHCALKKILQKS